MSDNWLKDCPVDTLRMIFSSLILMRGNTASTLRNLAVRDEEELDQLIDVVRKEMLKKASGGATERITEFGKMMEDLRKDE